MQPIFIEDIFNEQELVEIEFLKNNKTHERHEKDSGRLLCNLNDLSQDIKNKLCDIVKEKTGKNVIMSAEGYCLYSNKYGKPELLPHTDANDTMYILDYMLDGNVDWPVIIEEQEYHHKNNGALLFSGKTKVHWRPKRIFEDGEYLEMIFFHFIDPDNKISYSTNIAPELEDKIIKYRKQFGS